MPSELTLVLMLIVFPAVLGVLLVVGIRRWARGQKAPSTGYWPQLFLEAITIRGKRFPARRTRASWLDLGGTRTNYEPIPPGCIEKRNALKYPWRFTYLLLDVGDIDGLRLVAEAVENQQLDPVVYETGTGALFRAKGLVSEYRWTGDFHAVEVSLTGPGRFELMTG